MPLSIADALALVRADVDDLAKAQAQASASVATLATNQAQVVTDQEAVDAASAKLTLDLNTLESLIPVSTTSSRAGAKVDVAVTDQGFSPQTVEVRKGDTVVWSWTTSTSHSVTADDGTFDSGARVSPFKFTHDFHETGKFLYHCAFMNFMTGVVVVS
jgi:plastocyanin